MPSLQDLIERACADGAYELVIESGHTLVVATTRGRQNSGLPVSEDDIHQMLDRYLSPDQHVELAMGQRIEFDFPLRGTKGSWRVAVESNSEGTTVRATAPARPRSTGEFDSHTMNRARQEKRLPEHPGASRGQQVAHLEYAGTPLPAGLDELDIDLEFGGEDEELSLNVDGPARLLNEPVGIGQRPTNDFSRAYLDDADDGDHPYDIGDPLGDTPLNGMQVDAEPTDSDESAFDDMVLDDTQHDAEDDETSFAQVDADPNVRVSKATRTTLRQLEAIWQDDDTPVGPGASQSAMRLVETTPTLEAAMGVPSYIPEEESQYSESFYAGAANQGYVEEVPLAHELPQSSAADELVPVGSLVLTLASEDAQQLAGELAPTPSAVVEVEHLTDPSICEQLARLGLGTCLLLDHEDPSFALPWVLRRLEQGYRVIMVVHALTLEGAMRVLLGLHPRQQVLSWLAAHPCLLLAREPDGVALRDVSWHGLDRAA